MKKIFGGDTTPDNGNAALPPRENPATADPAKPGNGPRRELVHLVLRDTMRKHGVPSDWIDCRILSVMNRHRKSGVHVQFLVRKGDDQLLNYVHAFQESFRQEISKFDAQADQWLFSVAWQFDGKAAQTFSAMPEAASWSPVGNSGQQEAGDSLAPEEDADELATDLQTLQALISQPDDLSRLAPAKPQGQRGSGNS